MRTAEQIEAEINCIRTQLDNTLGELKHRLTPRELIRDRIDTLSRNEGGRYVLRAPAAIAGASVIGIIFAARQWFKARDS